MTRATDRHPFLHVWTRSAEAPFFDRDELGNVLVSYFENQHGDYLVTVASYETGDITLYHSDFDFKPCRFTPKYFEDRLGARSELRQAMAPVRWQ